MSMEKPEKLKMRIVHMKDGFKNDNGLNPINLNNETIKNISFEDPDKDLEFKRLIKLLEETNDPKEKEQIEFALRQLLLS